jgi:hypothetical protein
MNENFQGIDPNSDFNGQIIPNSWDCNAGSNFIFYPSLTGQHTYSQIPDNFRCSPTGTVFSNNDNLGPPGYYYYNPFYPYADNNNPVSMSPNSYSTYSANTWIGNSLYATENISNIPEGVYYCQSDNTYKNGTYTQCKNSTGCNQTNTWEVWGGPDPSDILIPIPYCPIPGSAYFTKYPQNDIHGYDLYNDSNINTVQACANHCLLIKGCGSFTYNGATKKCNTKSFSGGYSGLSPSTGWDAYLIRDPSFIQNNQ